MKKCFKLCVVMSALLAVAPAMATLYTIDLGDPDVADVGISTSDWGEPESGGGAVGRADGNYGFIGNGNSRMVWGHSTSGDDNDWATITFPEAVVSVEIRHLNGTEYDSFDVLVDNVYWGHYEGTDGGTEIWKTNSFSGTAGTVLMIDITSPGSEHRADWGQLAIDYVVADTIPEPATIVLLGLGALSLIRKKHS